jgi:hypothetical protein
MARADTASPTAAHDFGHDPVAQTYVVQGEVVPVAAVKRDLSGTLCAKCHAGAVSEIKSSVHFTTQAPTRRVMFPGGGSHGMLDRACGLPGSSAMVNYVGCSLFTTIGFAS